MKSSFPHLLVILISLTFTSIIAADDFKSAIITDTNNPLGLHVSGDHLLVIRNFTQTGGTNRGIVNTNLLSTGQSADVLEAALIDPASAPEIINNVVIAGPANITVMCDVGATCFITYRKVSN